MRIVTIIQARVGSTRLPNKVLLSLGNTSVLEYMIKRVLNAKTIGTLVVATTFLDEDQPIVDLCIKNNILVEKGHPTDLLDRHYQIAKKYNADAVVKIPSDCPLIDPIVIDHVIDHFHKNSDEIDYLSNLHPQSFPDGNDVEIMHFDVLHNAWIWANKHFEREHTTPYIWERPEIYALANIETGTKDFSKDYRWTLDYSEDYQLIVEIHNHLYNNNNNNIYTYQDIIKFLDSNPELKKINEQYNGVNWYRHHLDELKTIERNETKLL